ncbi:hypothetical protein, partial [Amycolatopsis thailandensis]|uniref:hypothetical protein n=1 Tax=Amycolatopsis thailandensis TaxID=589330 RepID=UPI0036426D3B
PDVPKVAFATPEADVRTSDTTRHICLTPQQFVETRVAAWIRSLRAGEDQPPAGPETPGDVAEACGETREEHERGSLIATSKPASGNRCTWASAPRADRGRGE